MRRAPLRSASFPGRTELTARETMQRLRPPSSRAARAAGLNVVFNLILAHLTLGEPVTMRDALGTVALTLGCAVVAVSYGSGSTKRPTPRAPRSPPRAAICPLDGRDRPKRHARARANTRASHQTTRWTSS